MGLNIQQTTVDEEEPDSLALSEFVYWQAEKVAFKDKTGDISDQAKFKDET